MPPNNEVGRMLSAILMLIMQFHHHVEWSKERDCVMDENASIIHPHLLWAVGLFVEFSRANLVIS